jgi:hypothetical protein
MVRLVRGECWWARGWRSLGVVCRCVIIFYHLDVEHTALCLFAKNSLQWKHCLSLRRWATLSGVSRWTDDAGLATDGEEVAEAVGAALEV